MKLIIYEFNVYNFKESNIFIEVYILEKYKDALKVINVCFIGANPMYFSRYNILFI
jgi:hypothetical protein